MLVLKQFGDFILYFCFFNENRESIFLWVAMNNGYNDEMKNYDVNKFQGVKHKCKILNLDHIFESW